MESYARIANGIVIEIVTLQPGEDILEMFHPSLKFVACPAGVNVAQGWTYNGAAFAPPTAPAGPSAEQLWGEYQAEAKAALDRSDIVAIRCVKAGVAFHDSWMAYVAALRAIVGAKTGDPTQPLPMQPPYPVGT